MEDWEKNQWQNIINNSWLYYKSLWVVYLFWGRSVLPQLVFNQIKTPTILYHHCARVSVLLVKRKRGRKRRQEQDVCGGGEKDVRKTGIRKVDQRSRIGRSEQETLPQLLSSIFSLRPPETHQQQGLHLHPSVFGSPPRDLASHGLVSSSSLAVHATWREWHVIPTSSPFKPYQLSRFIHIQ